MSVIWKNWTWENILERLKGITIDIINNALSKYKAFKEGHTYPFDTTNNGKGNLEKNTNKVKWQIDGYWKSLDPVDNNKE